MTPFQPNSGEVVLPITIAPALRRCRLIGASTSQGPSGDVVVEPSRVGRPLVRVKSLMVTGIPSSGPSGVPACQRCADAAAKRRASTSFTQVNAFTLGLSRAIRAKQSSTSVSGESEPSPKRVNASTAVRVSKESAIVTPHFLHRQHLAWRAVKRYSLRERAPVWRFRSRCD